MLPVVIDSVKTMLLANGKDVLNEALFSLGGLAHDREMFGATPASGANQEFAFCMLFEGFEFL